MKFVDYQNQKNISGHSSVTEASFPGFSQRPAVFEVLLVLRTHRRIASRPSPEGAHNLGGKVREAVPNFPQGLRGRNTMCHRRNHYIHRAQMPLVQEQGGRYKTGQDFMEAIRRPLGQGDGVNGELGGGARTVG